MLGELGKLHRGARGERVYQMDNSTCRAGELRCEVHTWSGPEVQLSVAGELGDSGLVGEGRSKLAWISDTEGLCSSLK